MDPVGRNIRNPGRVGEGDRIADAESEAEDEEEGKTGKEEAAVGWIRREVDLMESSRPVGHWIDKRYAKVRIEIMQD